MKRFLITVFVVGIVGIPLFIRGQEAPIPVIVDGDQVNYYREQERVEAKGNVEMKYKDIQVYCNEAIYDIKQNIAQITGDVKIISSEGVMCGNDAIYDFGQKKVVIDNVGLEAPPLYGGAQKGEGFQGKYILVGHQS